MGPRRGRVNGHEKIIQKSGGFSQGPNEKIFFWSPEKLGTGKEERLSFFLKEWHDHRIATELVRDTFGEQHEVDAGSAAAWANQAPDITCFLFQGGSGERGAQEGRSSKDNHASR